MQTATSPGLWGCVSKRWRGKPEFLSRAKNLREEYGIRYDDDLTRKQQQQREDLSADSWVWKQKAAVPSLEAQSCIPRTGESPYMQKRSGMQCTPNELIHPMYTIPLFTSNTMVYNTVWCTGSRCCVPVVLPFKTCYLYKILRVTIVIYMLCKCSDSWHALSWLMITGVCVC